MNKSVLIISILFFGGLFSCNQSPKNEKKEDFKSSISLLEDKIKNNLHNFDIKVADSLSEKYAEYASVFPQDTLAPDYMFKAAELSVASRNFRRALQYFDTIPQLYPKYAKNPQCQFMIGFIYDEHLKLKDKAAEAYGQMIDLYPQHELANDAKIQKENLKYTNEQLIEMFQNKQKSEK